MTLKKASHNQCKPRHSIDEFQLDDGQARLIIIPAFSSVHQVFAKEGSSWPNLFTRPLVGWVSGFHLDDASTATPKVFNGRSGEVSSSSSVVMHLDLPAQEFAKVNIINIFEAGTGDVITFPNTGFEVTDCFVNGKVTNFSEYILKNKIDLQLPLVADYLGAMINVSFQMNDETQKVVQLYGPVFEGVEYRVAKPVGDYEKAFAKQSRLHDGKAEFMCNCVLNFMYGKLEKKKIGKMLGPMTFGEIAYMLLNQTLVYLTIETRK